MIDAKLAGEGVEAADIEMPRSNVVDLMPALKASLGQVPEAAEAPKRKKATDVRQTGLKLPIKGGKGRVAAEKVEEPVKPARKRA